jgi:hypothetical protein
MRPDDEMNNAYLYCLIEAAQKFDIVLMLSQMMSNHAHTEFFDPYGWAVEFVHRFHTHLAKCVNAYRGRWENMWSIDPPCLVELIEIDDIVDKLIYTATNPVTPCSRVGPSRHDVPTSCFATTVRCPKRSRSSSRFPRSLATAKRSSRAFVEESPRRKRSAHANVRGILRQPWRDCPTTPEPRRGLRPRIAARNKQARIEALQRNKQFQILYREARKGWLAGEAVVFPSGTYWLRRFANVPTELVDPPPTRRTSN